jgi:hypothetical protein
VPAAQPPICEKFGRAVPGDNCGGLGDMPACDQHTIADQDLDDPLAYIKALQAPQA